MTVLGAARTARSLLFVPGDRPDRFDKALDAGAGLVVVDLEDAVRPGSRATAREAASKALSDGMPVAVRVNACGTRDHEADLQVLGGQPAVVMLAKASSAADIDRVSSRLAAGSAVIALVETAAGALAARDLAAHDSVVRLAFGALDLAAEIGVDPDDREILAPIRASLVLASAAAGLAGPVDGVTAVVDDLEGLAADVAHARRLGFGGRMCIHPRQVAITEQGFEPSAADLAWARRLLESASAGGVCIVDGAMVDKPVLDRARRILGKATLR